MAPDPPDPTVLASGRAVRAADVPDSRTSYRRGLSIVSTAIALGALVATLLPTPAHRPDGQDLGTAGPALGPFRLTERSGRTVADADLAGRVWIAAFTFTRCPSACPRISAVMKGLQTDLAGTGVQLVSLSVDPEHDTPAVLSRYAQSFGADPARWWFLTGPKADIYPLILDRFRLAVAESSPEDVRAGAMAVSHSGRLALVGRGNRVVGYFDSDDAEARGLLLREARALDARGRRGSLVARLPAVNATLNGTCALLLLAGWTLIRGGQVRAHAACMVAALVVSALFLACYLTYHYRVGSVPFRGVGPARFAYFTILVSHTLLAVAMLPLIGLTLARALRARFEAHARIACITFPIWLYVSLTGVVVYLMLYQWDVPSGYPL